VSDPLPINAIDITGYMLLGNKKLNIRITLDDVVDQESEDENEPATPSSEQNHVDDELVVSGEGTPVDRDDDVDEDVDEHEGGDRDDYDEDSMEDGEDVDEDEDEDEGGDLADRDDYDEDNVEDDEDVDEDDGEDEDVDADRDLADRDDYDEDSVEDSEDVDEDEDIDEDDDQDDDEGRDLADRDDYDEDSVEDGEDVDEDVDEESDLADRGDEYDEDDEYDEAGDEADEDQTEDEADHAAERAQPEVRSRPRRDAEDRDAEAAGRDRGQRAGASDLRNLLHPRARRRREAGREKTEETRGARPRPAVTDEGQPGPSSGQGSGTTAEKSQRASATGKTVNASERDSSVNVRPARRPAPPASRATQQSAEQPEPRQESQTVRRSGSNQPGQRQRRTPKTSGR
jgi:hypothetical protein